MNPNGGAETSCSSVRRSTDTEFGFGHCCVTIAAGSDPLLYLVSVVVAAKQGGACRSTLKRLTLSEIIEIGGPAYKEDDRQRLQAALRLGPTLPGIYHNLRSPTAPCTYSSKRRRRPGRSQRHCEYVCVQVQLRTIWLAASRK